MKKIWIKSATLQDFAAIEVGDWIEGVGMIMSHFEKNFVRRFGACHKTSASTRKVATECCPNAGEVCVGPCNRVKPLSEASTRPDDSCSHWDGQGCTFVYDEHTEEE